MTTYGKIPVCEIQIDSPHVVYGLVTSPRYVINEVMADASVEINATLTNAYADPNSKLLTALPQPILAGTTTSLWTTAASSGAGRWNQVTDPITNQYALSMDDATAGVAWSATQTAAGITGGPSLPVSTDAYNNPSYDSYGYTVKIVRGPAAPSAMSTPSNVYTIWNLSDNFRIYFGPGYPFVLQALESGSWVTIRTSTQIPDSEVYLENNNRTVVFQFLYYPFRQSLSVYIGQGDDDLSFGGYAVLRGGWGLYGENGKVRFSWFQLGYPLTWSYASGTKLTGFTPQTTPVYRVYPSPADMDFTGDTTQYTSVYSGGTWTYAHGQTVRMTGNPDPFVGPAWQYQLSGTNPNNASGLSTYSAIIHRSHVEFPAGTYIGNSSRYQVLTPMSVTEQYQFDWNTMSGTASADVVFDNWYGQMSGGPGMRAALITRGWALTENGVPTGEQYTYPAFYGWMGLTKGFDRADPLRKARFRIEDRSLTCRKCPNGVLPWFDAWCPYAKLRFLYQVGGIVSDPTGTGVDWLQNLPNCQSGPNPPDCPHVLLPAGTGSYPRGKAAPDASVWSEILKTSVDYRWISGFDYNGNVVSEPYDPTTGPYYGGSMGISPQSPFVFQGVGSIDYTGTPVLDEIVENFTADSSLDDLRTEVTLMGQQISDRSILIAHNEDNANTMLYNVDDPTFLGFRTPFFDINPEYIDADYIDQKAVLVAQQASIPTDNCSFSCWFQPNLYLFQIFGVYEPVSLGNAAQYYRATGLTHSYGVQPQFGSKMTGRTFIQAKSIANY